MLKDINNYPQNKQSEEYSDGYYDYQRYIIGLLGKSHFMTQYATEYKGEFMNKEIDQKTPHSERPLEIGSGGRGNIRTIYNGNMSGIYTVNDEDAVLEIKVPGVEASQIEVVRIDSTLRVRILSDNQEKFNPMTMPYGDQKLELILAEYESVTIVELDLGILTIEIARDRNIQHYEVHD